MLTLSNWLGNHSYIDLLPVLEYKYTLFFWIRTISSGFVDQNVQSHKTNHVQISKWFLAIPRLLVSDSSPLSRAQFVIE